MGARGNGLYSELVNGKEWEVIGLPFLGLISILDMEKTCKKVFICLLQILIYL